MKDKKAASYTLDKIELIEFSIAPRPKSFKLDEIKLNYSILISSQVAVEQKLVIQKVEIDMMTIDRQIMVGKMKVLIGYVISPFEDFVKLIPGQKDYEVAEELERHIRNISIGTSRGILYSRMQGSYLSATVLPIINDDEMEKSSVVTLSSSEHK